MTQGGGATSLSRHRGLATDLTDPKQRRQWWRLSGGSYARVGCLLMVTALVADGACGLRAQSKGEVTTVKLRQIHGALLEFRAGAGHLPDSLNMVCERDSRLCELEPFDMWRRDGWGRPITYVRRDGEFELSSTGRDGVAGTDDDVVLSSVTERSQVHKVAGCYKLQLPWWNEFPGNLVILDTLPLGSGYVLSPDAGPYIGRWVLQGPNGVRLSWIRADQSVTLVLRQHGDSLLGAVVGKNRRVAGARIGCP